MTKINTTRFGEIEFKEEDIIHFEKGLPGFIQEKQFIIVQLESGNPLAFLQSVLNPDLAFVITNPFVYYQDYEFEIDEQIKEELEIKDIEDVSVWGILSIPDKFEKTTINLKGPLVINTRVKKGKQIILQDKEDKLIKTPLFPHLIEEGGK